MTRRPPACWHTKIRPSGAIAMAVGLDRPLATCDSVKPAGRVAASPGPLAAAQPSATARSWTNRPRRRGAGQDGVSDVTQPPPLTRAFAPGITRVLTEERILSAGPLLHSH